MSDTTEHSKWFLTLEGVEMDEEDDFTLEFIDTSNILGEPTLERTFLDKLINLSMKWEHYSLFKNLKKIISDTNQDVSDLAIWALMGVVKENQQKVGILLGALPDGMLHVIAIWPKYFIDQLIADITLFEEVVDKFVSDPEFWHQVDLIIGY